MHSCSGCSTKWSGGAMAHCGRCHEHFSTVGNFDKHRAGNVDARRCVDPRTLVTAEGEPMLELRTSGATPTWAAPADPDINERFNRGNTG